MKIGVTCALDAPKGSPFPLINPDIYQIIDYLADRKFDSIELHLLRPGEVDGYKIRDYCATKGITVSSIGTGMAYGKERLSITSPDADIRKRAVVRLKEQLDLASILECPIIIGSIRGKISCDENLEMVNRRMIDSCKELCDHAEKGRGSIVIEAMSRVETNYLNTAEEVLGLIGCVGSHKLGVHLDTYHMNIEESDWQRPVFLCGKRLRHVHIVDNTRGYPGAGLIDFRSFLEALKKIDYSRHLVMECSAIPDGKTAVERGLSCLRSLLWDLEQPV